MDENLTKNIEIIGEWFLPNSDEKIPGVFQYTDGQSKIKLLRSFSNMIKSGPQNMVTVKTIHGQTQHGVVTLTDTHFYFQYTVGFVHSAIFGHLLDENHSIKKLGFKFDLLHEWAISKYPYNSVTANILIQRPSEKFSFIFDGIQHTLYVSLGSSVRHLEGTKTYPLSNFYFESEEGKSVHAFFDSVIATKYFLMLVMGRNINLTSMSILSENFQSHDVFLPVSKKENRGSDLDHFFNISFIRENYSKILTNWFDFYFKNKYLLKMFFKTMNKTTVELIDFFIYASLLEGYYKLSYNGESRYKERIKIVLKKFENDFSNFNEFIDLVDQMRHDNFHFNKRDELDEDLLGRITHDLFFLIRLIFLRHVGLDVDFNTNPNLKKLLFLINSTKI